MNYNQIEKELEDLEINDLKTAIKGNLLTRLENRLSNLEEDKTYIVDFKYDNDLDTAVYVIERKVDELIEEYEENCISVVENKKMKNKEYER